MFEFRRALAEGTVASKLKECNMRLTNCDVFLDEMRAHGGNNNGLYNACSQLAEVDELNIDMPILEDYSLQPKASEYDKDFYIFVRDKRGELVQIINKLMAMP